MSMDISGDLENTRCPEIIKILSLGKRTGRLFLSNGAENGDIFFRDGSVIHSQSGLLQGVKSIYELSIWTSGIYRFFVDEAPEMMTIDISIDDILAEIANRIRQMDKVTSLIPSSSTVYMLEPDLDEKEFTLKSVQWKIIVHINGKKSIAEIAQNIGIGISDAMKVFYTLIKLGILKEAGDLNADVSGTIAELPDTAFINSVKNDLVKAIGPIAPIIISETAKDMDIDLVSDDIGQKAALIETLSSRIPDENMSLMFLDTMTDWLKSEE